LGLRGSGWQATEKICLPGGRSPVNGAFYFAVLCGKPNFSDG
jgi:hypothetical protein